MHRYKLIVAGVCGATALLALTAMGAEWYVALAAGFITMVATDAALRAIAKKSV